MTTCKHGTYVGGPLGPDYLCGACEDGVDFSLANHGSIVTVTPLTHAATAWLHQNTDGQWFGSALCVEPRYLEALVEGIEAEGFKL